MEQGGYSPKELHFAKEGQEKLISGISKMAAAVKSTLGPMGNTVIIESPEHTHGITVTKDGVTVAREFGGTNDARGGRPNCVPCGRWYNYGDSSY